MGRLLCFIAGIATGAIGLALAQDANQDPVKLSPQYYTVRFENDRVRVLEYR